MLQYIQWLLYIIVCTTYLQHVWYNYTLTGGLFLNIIYKLFIFNILIKLAFYLATIN